MGGGSHRGAGNGFSKAAFAYGMASSAISGINAATGQSRESANSDSMLYLTTANAMNTGASVGAARAAQGMYGSTGWAYRSGEDQASATYSLWQNSGGPGMFAKMQQASASQALSSPMMTGAQRASFTNSLYSVPGMIGLHRVGIDTVGKGGSRQTPLQVANQILNQVDPQQTIRDPADIQRLITDPASNLRMTLGNWVAGGVISGDQVQPILDNIQTILKARAHGTNVSQLQTLMNTYKPGNASAKKLASMQIGNSAVQDVQNLDATKRQRTINELGGFEKGLEESTSALTDFNTALNAILSATGISGLTGLFHGGTANGKLGGVLGMSKMLGPMGGVFGTVSSMGGVSGVGSSIMGEAGSLLGHIGIGGNNDDRMSLKGASTGSSGGSRGGGSAGSGGASGGASSSRGSGAKGSAGSIRLTWPVNPHPLGTPFGASGSHWASGHHTGQDFEVGTGTPVYAAGPGRVNFSGNDGSYGNAIHIDHGGGIWTLYGHNSRLVARVGTVVSAGSLISYSGATGNVTGPHLHFEVRKGRDSYFNAVNPMPYLTGGVSVPSGGTPAGSGGPSTGSGSSTDLGTGTSLTDTSTTSSFYSGSGFSAGMSELDVLGAGMSSGGGGSTMTTTSSSSMGGGGTSTSMPSTSTPIHKPPMGPSGPSVGGGKRYSRTYNQDTVGVVTATDYPGWLKNSEWSSLVSLINSESGFNNVAQNPTSTAYGLFQFLDSTWKGYGPKTSNPDLQSHYGLKYIHDRYGDPIKAWNFKKAHNWYDKGAWEIQADEDARVHKGEMIIQKPAADQIRNILVNGNPYGAMGNQSKGSGQGVTLQFNEGSIKITVQGSGATAETARALGKGFVDQVMTDSRIQNLQKGVLR
jgi:hypothetical protein